MKRALPVLALAGLVAAVQATNIMSLLRDTPAELFTARDYEFFDAALTKALPQAKVIGEVVKQEGEARVIIDSVGFRMDKV